MKVERSYYKNKKHFYNIRRFKAIEDILKKHQGYMNRGNNIARKILNFLHSNQMEESCFTEVA